MQRARNSRSLGAALRRIRIYLREDAVRLVAAKSNDLGDVCAWIFVSACKVRNLFHESRAWSDASRSPYHKPYTPLREA